MRGELKHESVQSYEELESFDVEPKSTQREAILAAIEAIAAFGATEKSVQITTVKDDAGNWDASIDWFETYDDDDEEA